MVTELQSKSIITNRDRQIVKAGRDKELADLREDRKREAEIYNSKMLGDLPTIEEMIKDIRTPNKIEAVEEEDFVIRSLLRHGKTSKIIQDLNEKHKDFRFTPKDVQEFIYEYKDAINKQAEISKARTTRRMMKTKEGVTHELLELAELSKRLAVKYDEDDDHTSAISAIKAAADIFFRNAKIEGLFDEKTTININTQMDELVSNVASAKNSSFTESVFEAVKKSQDGNVVIDAEFTEEKEDANNRS